MTRSSLAAVGDLRSLCGAHLIPAAACQLPGNASGEGHAGSRPGACLLECFRLRSHLPNCRLLAGRCEQHDRAADAGHLGSVDPVTRFLIEKRPRKRDIPGRFGRRSRASSWFANARMPRTCTVCSHAERSQIDQELVRGLPYRDISGRFDLSKSAVERHASEHLAAAIARDPSACNGVTSNGLIAELRVLREVTLGVLEEARSAEQHALALQAIARLEKQAELVGRLAGELVERQRIETISVVFSAEWLKLRPIILQALDPFPEAADAMARALADAGA